MKFLSEKNPDTQRSYEIVDEGLSKKAVVVIVARCEVLYEGRARSRLAEGDRMLMVKPDGSFLVHQDRNLDPVNWQPPKSKCRAYIKNGLLHVEGVRRNPPERLDVEIHSTHLASYFIGEDSKDLEQVGYEADMVDMVVESPDLIEKGFRPTSREYATPNGFIDILGKDQNGTLMVLEFKSRRAGTNAVKQLKRYLDCFEDHKEFVRGVLVAPSLTEEASELLIKYEMEFKELKPPMDFGEDKNLTLDFFGAA